MKNVELYLFSPTGGTRKVAETFAGALAEEVKIIDLLDRNVTVLKAESETMIAAVPVFAGRIPSVAREKLKTLQGEGKKAVALAVYGIRAYDDALLELADLLKECGFTVVAAGAFNAQHSMVPAVGAGRPDEKDMAEIREFASKTAAKIEAGNLTSVEVPGNHPYKEEMAVTNTPVSGEACVFCGACENICPTEAIKVEEGEVKTELAKCIDCLACVAVCPTKARTLAPAHQAVLDEKLGPLVDVYRENEMFV